MKLSNEDLIKILKGAAIAGAGAGTIYGLEGLAQLNFGIWQPVAVAIASILVNIIRKAVTK